MPDTKKMFSSTCKLGSTSSRISTTTTKSLKLQPTRKSGNGDSDCVENKVLKLHDRLLNTFRGFVNQMDELFLSLKAEERLSSHGYIPEFTSYQDICDKLRLEVLIAIDKLQITPFAGESYNGNNIEFLHKMNNLNYQLTDIASQYHNAIKEFGFGREDEKIDDEK